MGGPLQTGQVSSKSVRWLVPPLPGPFVDALLRRKGVTELGDQYTFDVTDLPSNNVIVNVIEKSTGHLNCPKSASMDI